ncbi:MAG: glucose 1-dehydrogenase [Chloroflexales bacterium]|nr:glucose 1-dehydrogenase [Chloroflexales bacterium]
MTQTAHCARPLAGKAALVTGGGSGIGRAICLAFAQAGAHVVVAGRTLGKIALVAEEIRTNGGQVATVAGDVSRGADVQAMVGAALEQFGGLDVLVNNAGISPSGSVTAISEAEWDECIAVDLRSVFLGAKYAIPAMQRYGGGVILNTAGTFGLRPARGKAAYAAAKAGVINLTRAIALDYAHDAIRCNAICPGFVATPLTEGVDPAERDRFLAQYQPLSGVIQADEVAALAVYLASDAARMITGQTFVIDAGQQAGIY